MKQDHVHSSLLGLGLATPQNTAEQTHVYEFMRQVACHSGVNGGAFDSFLKKIFLNGGIEHRQSVIADYAKDDPAEFAFFPPDWAMEPFPCTEQRMALYQVESVNLAEKACTQALRQAKCNADEITHVVLVTCTGFFSPGPDVHLIERLRLSPTVERIQIGFMGCCAGFNGFQAIENILSRQPQAVVLLVCLELCSLHFQKKPIRDLWVANSLFSDGAAATVWGHRQKFPYGLLQLKQTHSQLLVDSQNDMTWRMGNHGFEMRVKPEVPKKLEGAAPNFLYKMLDKAQYSQRCVSGWAIHPGGRKIVESLQTALNLPDETLAASYEVLRQHGNMSSATLFFVLQNELARNDQAGLYAALGFGPGLTIEGALFERE